MPIDFDEILMNKLTQKMLTKTEVSKNQNCARSAILNSFTSVFWNITWQRYNPAVFNAPVEGNPIVILRRHKMMPLSGGEYV